MTTQSLILGQSCTIKQMLNLTQKIKYITGLEFLPVYHFINGFTHLTDDDDLPQEWISPFETYYVGGERSQRLCPENRAHVSHLTLECLLVDM